jgi:hypothetical protein
MSEPVRICRSGSRAGDGVGLVDAGGASRRVAAATLTDALVRARGNALEPVAGARGRVRRCA